MKGLYKTLWFCSIVCLGTPGSLAAQNSAQAVIKAVDVDKITGCSATPRKFFPAESCKNQFSLTSPDGNLKSMVTPLNKHGESRLEIRKANGDLLLKHDFVSFDQEHGYVIMRAAWSPDSQFFYFTMRSSGGHGSWKAFSNFYSRSKNKLFNLEDYLEPMARIDFSIEAPDLVHATMWVKGVVDGVYENVLPITFRLSDIKAHKPGADLSGQIDPALLVGSEQR